MLGLLMPFFGSMARHALTLAAGYLVSAGLLPQAQVNGFVAACLLFAGIGWAAWQKLNQPGMLASLQARQAQKNVNGKLAAAKAFEGSPNGLLALLAGAAVLGLVLAAPAPASAQAIFLPWSNAASSKVKKPKIIKVVPPMKLGLTDLISGNSGSSLLDQLFANLQKASIDDLQYAKALADGVKDSKPAAARSACYGAWLQMLATVTSAQATVAGAPEKPGTLQPHLFTRFEQLSQVADNLAPLSDFQRACAPVAQAMRMNIPQFVLAVVGGGLSLGKLGVLP